VLRKIGEDVTETLEHAARWVIQHEKFSCRSRSVRNALMIDASRLSCAKTDGGLPRRDA
jgi:hypothetical protein